MTHDGLVIDDTAFFQVYPFVKRTIDPPDDRVVRTEAPTDGEILSAILAGINNRPCILDRDYYGMPTDNEYMVPSMPERLRIAHFLLPTVRALVTGRVVDRFDFRCGGSCGNEECEHA